MAVAMKPVPDPGAPQLAKLARLRRWLRLMLLAMVVLVGAALVLAARGMRPAAVRGYVELAMALGLAMLMLATWGGISLRGKAGSPPPGCPPPDAPE